MESGSRRYSHSIPPPHQALNSRNTIHSLEMKFVLCVPSINNSDLQNHWVLWGEADISCWCTAVAQAETHRCYGMLVPE